MVFGVCVESDCDSLKGSGVGLGLHRVGGGGGSGGGGRGCGEIKKEPWLNTGPVPRREREGLAGADPRGTNLP